MNCRGLQDLRKRKDVLNFMRQKGGSIVCLQDTHFSSQDGCIVRSQWGAEHIYSPGRTNSRGTSTFLNNNFEYELLESHKDNLGNLLALKLDINKMFTLTIVNIYGPNNDSPSFYKDLKIIIEKFSSDFQIICGDWNLVLDPDLDCYIYLYVNNPKVRNNLLKIMESKD